MAHLFPDTRGVVRMKMVAWIAGAAALTLAGTAALAAGPSGDPAKGRTVFARCAMCHDLNRGTTLIGPSMKGVLGRKSGSMPNFAYSAAMKGKNVVWNPATIDTFITAPSKFVPGTKMAFGGVPNPQERADLIAYLKQAAH
jgi:cytochrome c